MISQLLILLDQLIFFVWSSLTKGDPNYTLLQVSVNDIIMIFAFAFGPINHAEFNNIILRAIPATSQKPNSVIQSLNDYYTNYNSNVHRGVHKLSVEATDEYEKARFKIADFINASSNEIIWTRNTSESINIVSINPTSSFCSYF